MIESWSVKDIDMTGFFHYMEQPGTSTDNASVSKIFSKLGVNDIMLDKVMKNLDMMVVEDIVQLTIGTVAVVVALVEMVVMQVLELMELEV